LKHGASVTVRSNAYGYNAIDLCPKLPPELKKLVEPHVDKVLTAGFQNISFRDLEGARPHHNRTHVVDAVLPHKDVHGGVGSGGGSSSAKEKPLRILPDELRALDKQKQTAEAPAPKQQQQQQTAVAPPAQKPTAAAATAAISSAQQPFVFSYSGDNNNNNTSNTSFLAASSVVFKPPAATAPTAKEPTKQ